MSDVVQLKHSKNKTFPQSIEYFPTSLGDHQGVLLVNVRGAFVFFLVKGGFCLGIVGTGLCVCVGGGPVNFSVEAFILLSEHSTVQEL